jgi:hypothetical protein
MFNNGDNNRTLIIVAIVLVAIVLIANYSKKKEGFEQVASSTKSASKVFSSDVSEATKAVQSAGTEQSNEGVHNEQLKETVDARRATARNLHSVNNGYTLNTDLSEFNGVADEAPLTAQDLLPKDCSNHEWFDVPKQSISVTDATILADPEFKQGINTTMSSRRGMVYDVRGCVSVPHVDIGPFNNKVTEIPLCNGLC